MTHLGIDFVSKKRIEHIIKQGYKDNFIEHLFSRSERARIESLDESSQVIEIASGFALKEAVIKASGDRLTLADLRIIRLIDDSQRRLSNSTRAIARDLSFFVSACCLDNDVVAVAISRENA